MTEVFVQVKRNINDEPLDDSMIVLVLSYELAWAKVLVPIALTDDNLSYVLSWAMQIANNALAKVGFTAILAQLETPE